MIAGVVLHRDADVLDLADDGSIILEHSQVFRTMNIVHTDTNVGL